MAERIDNTVLHTGITKFKNTSPQDFPAKNIEIVLAHGDPIEDDSTFRTFVVIDRKPA